MLKRVFGVSTVATGLLAVLIDLAAAAAGKSIFYVTAVLMLVFTIMMSIWIKREW